MIKLLLIKELGYHLNRNKKINFFPIVKAIIQHQYIVQKVSPLQVLQLIIFTESKLEPESPLTLKEHKIK